MSLIARTINLQGKFQRIELTNEEIEKIQNELLEHNHNEIKRIEKLLENDGNSNNNTFKAMCDKQLLSSFTVWQNALEDKIFRMRQGNKQDFGKVNDIEKDLKEKLQSVK